MALSGSSPLNQPGSSPGGFGGSKGSMDDPMVHSHIKEAATVRMRQGVEMAKQGAISLAGELKTYIQEGPAGVSILCFCGGFVTTFVGLIGLFNLSGMLFSPFNYLLDAYLCTFGVVTVLLEADVETVKTMSLLGRTAPFLEKYQNEVFDRAQVLTTLRGRGFFYFFVGSLAITQCTFCLLFLVGVWNVLMGLICFLMSFGINPVPHRQALPTVEDRSSAV
mmetsp:Transcript_18224/g.38965  ORF Transcript_18224/g.38965 Transcript_18224/m.38965 type:complete len:221 (+) Transcript_18224:193-855(+)